MHIDERQNYMKKIFILLFLLPLLVNAQKLPDFGFSKVRIIEPDKTIIAEIKAVNSNPHVRPDLFYYWYSTNIIHTTQGGFSGKLLNGLYTEYYLNKNLKEQGNFKKGLKDGQWKTWNEDGTLVKITAWNDGVSVPADYATFWQKLNIFRRHGKHTAADSLSKPK